MFLLKSIWKRLSAAMLLALLLGSGLLATAGAAQASGELYNWKDSTDTVISASGGSYSAPFELKKLPADVQGQAFEGQGMVTCGSTPVQSDIIIHVKNTDYTKTFPTPGSLEFTSTCSTASLDAAPFITKDAAGTNPADNSQTCDQGSLSWIACPVIGQLAGVITTLTKSVLEPLLQVHPINASETPGLYATWAHIKDFAEILFIIAFMIMIFATVTGDIFDSYTVKKLLPRIIIAAILVNFSFLFSGMLIDLGNILGLGIDGVISGISGAGSGAHSVSNFLGQISAFLIAIVGGYGAFVVFASWLAIGPILVGILLSLLAVLLTLGARYIAIAVLVCISPLAFAAWVLPNTEHYFKSWYTALIRLVMMYPIVIAVLSFAGRINELLGTSGNQLTTSGAGDVVVAIVKPFIIISTFLVIPYTFRWAGSALGVLGNSFSKMTGGTQDRFKKSDFAERGRMERSSRRNERVMALRNPDSALSKWAAKGGRMRRATAGGLVSAAAIQMGGTASDPASMNRLYAKNMKAYGKELDALPEADNPGNIQTALKAAFGDTEAMGKLRKNAPTLVPYTRTAAGRAALAAKRASTETTEISEMNQVLKAPSRHFPAPSKQLSNEYSAINSAMGKDRRAKPFILSRVSSENPNYELKDVAGNVIGTIQRSVGDVDINGVINNLRTMNAPTFRDKFAGTNLAVLHQRTDARATADEQRDAYELSQATVEGIDATVISQTFDPGNRNALPLSTKIDWYKAFKANNDVFMHTPEGERVTDAAIGHLSDDPTLLEQLRTVAGIPEATFNGLASDQARADAIRTWLNT